MTPAEKEKLLKREIRELRASMKASGIPIRSCFSGGHTSESLRANSRLFALKTELHKLGTP